MASFSDSFPRTTKDIIKTADIFIEASVPEQEEWWEDNLKKGYCTWEKVGKVFLPLESAFSAYFYLYKINGWPVCFYHREGSRKVLSVDAPYIKKHFKRHIFSRLKIFKAEDFYNVLYELERRVEGGEGLVLWDHLKTP